MWKYVIGFKRKYQINDQGELRHTKNQRLIKGHMDHGKLRVKLYRSRNDYIHYNLDRLVAIHFLPIVPSIEAWFVRLRHIDGNVLNNRADNLVWVNR